MSKIVNLRDQYVHYIYCFICISERQYLNLMKVLISLNVYESVYQLPLHSSNIGIPDVIFRFKDLIV